MTIEIDEAIVLQSQLTEQGVRLRIAVALFDERMFTLGQAAQFAGLPQAIFQQELGRRQVPVHYDADDLRADMANLELA